MPQTRSMNYETNVNVKAFLKLIRYAEHKRDGDRVYYVLYGGQQTFTDTSKHPDLAILAWGKRSTAAGAYQIRKATWDEAVKNGIAMDFTPASQDKIALWLIQRRGALPHIRANELEKAIVLLRTEWVSLPGGTQSKMTIAEAKQRFEKYLTECKQ